MFSHDGTFDGTQVKRAFTIEPFSNKGDYYAAAVWKLCSLYNNRQPKDAASVNLLKEWIKKFRETGSALNQLIQGLAPTVPIKENL